MYRKDEMNILKALIFMRLAAIFCFSSLMYMTQTYSIFMVTNVVIYVFQFGFSVYMFFEYLYEADTFHQKRKIFDKMMLKIDFFIITFAFWGMYRVYGIELVDN